METELLKKLRVVTAICFEFCKNPERSLLFLRTQVTQIQITFSGNLIIFLIKVNCKKKNKEERSTLYLNPWYRSGPK